MDKNILNICEIDNIYMEKICTFAVLFENYIFAYF